jgi:hypothetical protein
MNSATRRMPAAASGPPRVIRLTTSPASTGVATPMTASNTTTTRNTAMSRR